MEVTSRAPERVAVSGGERNTSGFDVRSWKGLTQILKAAKESGMEPDAYADFRDAVLEYAQTGGTNREIQSKIASIASKLDVPPVPQGRGKQKEAKRFGFGGARPEPHFHVSHAAVHPKQKQVEPKKATQPKPVAPLQPRPSPTSPQTLVQPPSPKPAPPPSPSAPKPIPPASPSPTSPQPPAPQPQAVTSGETKTLDDYKARIAKIKQTVNAHIGNPVMLLDSANALGREYMSALVNAMKAASGGAPGTLTTSMNNLEEVFKKIMAMPPGSVQSAPPSPPPAPPKPTPSPQPQPPKPPEPKPTPPPPKPRPSEPRPAPSSPQPPTPRPVPSAPQREKIQPPPKPVSPPKPTQQTPFPPSKPREVSTPHTRVPIRINRRSEQRLPPHPAPLPHREPLTPQPKRQVATTPTTPPPTHRDMPPRPVPPPTPESELVSAPPKPKLAVPSTPPTAGDLPVTVPSGVKTDLDSPEINSALNLLLLEWKLFRASGIFGTGSGGHEHPLYQKLKSLPMSIIATGKWEGAKKEEILSVRDYINGWLHEQGISYVPTESFEHYLRRVVKKVLERRKQ